MDPDPEEDFRPRFLAPITQRRDYVHRPSEAVPLEPECVGPAILKNYTEVNRQIFDHQHALDVAVAQVVRPTRTVDDRVRDVQARAKNARVDLSRELFLMRRDIDRATAGGRRVPARVYDRLEGLEALLDGVDRRANVKWSGVFARFPSGPAIATHS